MMGLLTDQRGAPELLERVEAGSRENVEETFESIYRRRYRDVFRYALLMLRHEAEAKDAVVVDGTAVGTCDLASILQAIQADLDKWAAATASSAASAPASTPDSTTAS